MTSKNSFWDSSRENHKRRIWVWIVTVLSQLLIYGGMTMIYLSRIKGFNEDGNYRSAEAFWQAMYQAAKDALGFSDNLYGIIFILAALIAMQGFSYLYDRRKVDLYHSVPVSKNRRFAVVYTNGLIIYLTARLLGLLLGTGIAASQGAVNAEVMAEAGLAFLWNLAFFLFYYHLMILAVMVTGNRFVTICGFLVLSFYEFAAYTLINSLRANFFHTYSGYFIYQEARFCPMSDYTANIWQLKNAKNASEAARIAMPLAARWIGIALVILVIAWFAYKKRASEAAGKAVAYGFLKPVLKVAVAIPAAYLAGQLVYDTSYQNELLLVAGMLAGGLIVCAAMEVIYDFDIKSLFRHLLSSAVALAGILAIFCIFKWDLFGYDNYIPAQNKIESIAIDAGGYYDDYWDEDGHYVNGSDYQKETMFLTDTEPVLALVEKAEQIDPEAENNDGTIAAMEILYRLQSGREKARRIWVNYDDPETEELLNRIFSTDAFKKGKFQGIQDETDRVEAVNYSNGAARTIVPKEAAKKLRDAWVKDMEQFDFSLAKNNRPCGVVIMAYGADMDYVQRRYFVYDSFVNTIELLKHYEAYYPVELNVADIDSIAVTCYHNEISNDPDAVFRDDTRYGAVADAEYVDTYVDCTVQETFYEEAQIAQILPHIYPSYIDAPWSLYGESTDDPNNYSLEVVFKKDSAYPYERGSYYFNYSFRQGEVPDFVKEATAYTPQ